MRHFLGQNQLLVQFSRGFCQPIEFSVNLDCVVLKTLTRVLEVFQTQVGPTRA